MNIIDIYDKLKSSYKNYIGSFVSIKDERSGCFSHGQD